ncbi:MAG: FAD-binding protein [Streptococcus suis]
MIPVEQQTKGISDAKKIIGLGRGASDTETIKIAFEIPNKINAQVGVTRPLTELDIFSIENQIGQSGHTVKPKVIMGTSKNTSRASRASNLSLIYSLFLVNFCL